MFPNLNKGQIIFSGILGDNEVPTLLTQISSFFRPDTWVFLEGEVGTGKTFLVQQLLNNLSQSSETSSPTFALLNRINFRSKRECAFNTIVHIDFYRLKTGKELCFLGIEAELHPQALLVAEWESLLEEEDWEDFFATTYCSFPENILQIQIEYTSDSPLRRRYEVILFKPHLA